MGLPGTGTKVSGCLGELTSGPIIRCYGAWYRGDMGILSGHIKSTEPASRGFEILFSAGLSRQGPRTSLQRSSVSAL